MHLVIKFFLPASVQIGFNACSHFFRATMIFWVRNHPANILKNRWTTFYSRNSYLKNITVGKVRPKVTKMEFIEFEIFNGSAWVFLYLHSLKARYRAPNVNQRGLEVLSHFIETINPNNINTCLKDCRVPLSPFQHSTRWLLKLLISSYCSRLLRFLRTYFRQ